jgi:hypothetical protein
MQRPPASRRRSPKRGVMNVPPSVQIVGNAMVASSVRSIRANNVTRERLVNHVIRETRATHVNHVNRVNNAIRVTHVNNVILVNNVIRASRVVTNGGSSRGLISLTSRVRRNRPQRRNPAASLVG